MDSTILLNNGIRMPVFGLGTWLSQPGEVEAAVGVAIDAGYRLIDTAYVYGNETEIGNALQKAFKQGKLKRDQIFVTTKLYSAMHRPEHVRESLESSLKKLQLDYVDLFLMHIPCAFKRIPGTDRSEIGPNKIPVPDREIGILDTWKGMEAVCNAKLTRAIGLSNFNAEQVQRVFDHSTIKPANLQNECHLYFPQYEIHDLCKRLNISFTAYAPIGSPGRVVVGEQAPIKLTWPDHGVPMENPVVLELAKAHGKTPAHVLMRWLIQRGIAVIPKSVNAGRIIENAKVFDFKLTDEEMNKLKSVNINERFFLQDYVEGHPDDPFKDERSKMNKV